MSSTAEKTVDELLEEERSWPPEDMTGHDRLWRWFGLSYASFLTLPRVLMHQMPDEWQDQMAALLEEYQETWEGVEGVRSTTVNFRGEDGAFTKPPRWLCRYRHPDREKVEALRRSHED